MKGGLVVVYMFTYVDLLLPSAVYTGKIIDRTFLQSTMAVRVKV